MVWRFPGLFYSRISLVGAALALATLAAILFLILIDLIGVRPKPYIGILTYIILPAFLILGLLLIAFGMFLERRKRRLAGVVEVPAYPRIDFNDPSQRGAFLFFAGATLLLLLLTMVGSYRAYEVTGSTTFCGELCHSVMGPQFTTYQRSPHARVPCVECHVGPGVGWYARSKFSGAYKVYAALLRTYPRPISSPPGHLRPAQEICLQCHWPEKFFGIQRKLFTFYAQDEQNTKRQVLMLVRTGGGSPGRGSGIHWHMNITNEVSYIARDPAKQVIPWVEVKNPQGQVTEYVSTEDPLTAEEIAKLEKQRMDCMDCHNRPAHIFLPPSRALDEAFLQGWIDPSLPFIKKVAVELLAKPYSDTPKALVEIETGLREFYRKTYPDLLQRGRKAVQKAIAEVKRIYQENFFPEMRVSWQAYPDNIGHSIFPGCFRCHDGKHQSADGRVIPKDCDICHAVLSQEEGKTASALRPFEHPIDLGDLKEVNCSDCHTGGSGP